MWETWKAEKETLRRQMLTKRKQTALEEQFLWDRQIADRILSLAEFKEADTVYCYASVRKETGTEYLIKSFLERNIRVALPRVDGSSISFWYIEGLRDLEPGCMKIPEPGRHCPLAEAFEAPVIVPGVAFGKDFSRMGYGKGFYDRFFEREPFHLKTAICYEFQLMETVPSEAHDVKMDGIVTQDRYLRRIQGRERKRG